MLEEFPVLHTLRNNEMSRNSAESMNFRINFSDILYYFYSVESFWQLYDPLMLCTCCLQADHAL